jgi:regulatory protein
MSSFFKKRKIKSKTPLEYASRILSRKDYSEKDLLKKISEHFGFDEAREAVEKLKEYGYVDDERFRDMYICSRVRSGYGIFRISSDLYEKGLDDDLSDIDEICEKSHINRHEILKDSIVKYLERKKSDDIYGLKQKCKAYFYRRGHPLDEVSAIIERELER